MSLNVSRSTRKPPTNSFIPTNDFHQVRLSEYRREYAIKEHAAPPDQLPVSFFVPTLQSICADLLAQNFSSMMEIDALKVDHPKLYDMILTRVGTEEPLSISVPRISDERYWKRACECRWSLGQLSKYAEGRLIGKEVRWKQLFLERALSDYLLSLRSGFGQLSQLHGSPSELRSLRGAVVHLQDDDDENGIDIGISMEETIQLEKLCLVCKDYVHRIDLPCQYSHIDFYEQLFSKLPSVYELRLSYGASNAGVGFHRHMIGFSNEDARIVSILLKRYSPLLALSLPSNRLSTLHVQAICSALVGNTTLRVLDLSSNALQDDAIVVVATILSQPSFLLEELYLGNNTIRADGAKAISSALSLNRSLRVLDVHQNRIPDEVGGPELIRSLVLHPTLQALNLGSNCLGPFFIEALHEVLPQLTLLTSLDLSGNRYFGPSECDKLHIALESQDGADSIGSKAEEVGVLATTAVNFMPDTISEKPKEIVYLLLEAVKSNQSLRQLDIRACNLSSEDVAQIEGVVYERVRQNDREEIAAKEHVLKQQDSERVAAKILRTRGPINSLTF